MRPREDSPRAGAAAERRPGITGWLVCIALVALLLHLVVVSLLGYLGRAEFVAADRRPAPDRRAGITAALDDQAARMPDEVGQVAGPGLGRIADHAIPVDDDMASAGARPACSGPGS